MKATPKPAEFREDLLDVPAALDSLVDGSEAGILTAHLESIPDSVKLSSHNQLLFRAEFDIRLDLAPIPRLIDSSETFSAPDQLHWLVFRELEQQLRGAIRDQLLGLVGTDWIKQRVPVPSIYSIVPPNDGSALRHGHHFEPVDFVIDHGRGHHDAYSAGSCQRIYARACGCRQRPRCHREELIESERGWSGREAFVTMMQTADLGQGNDRSRPGRLNGSSIRCVLAERQVGP